MRLRQVFFSAVLLLVGIGAGLLGSRWSQGAESASRPATTTARNTPSKSADQGAQHRVLYWADPMNPHVHVDHPMKDNMGMAYIPIYASGASKGKTSGLHIDPRFAQSLGVRLTTAQVRPMGHALHSVGTVEVDQNRVYTITPRFSGWIKRLNIRAVGDAVAKGQILAEVYSPELYSAQKEYLIARQQEAAPGGWALLEASKERLRLFGMPRGAMATLERTGKPLRDVPVMAHESGVVMILNVRQGGFVSSKTTFYEIANLDRVWVNVALYSNQLPWVRIGNPVRLHAPAYPGKIWQGKLNFLYPTIDPQTRTVTARVSFDNPGDVLRPGMYANATLLANLHPALAVPDSAILQTQKGDYAMLAQSKGHFLPVQVALGPEADGWAEVRQGLKAGDKVVESAQFLLYSASQFQSVKARMLGGAATLAGNTPSGMGTGTTRSAAGDLPHASQASPTVPSYPNLPAASGSKTAPTAQGGSMAGMNMAPAGAGS